MRCAPILSTATAATPKAAESGDSRPEASLPGRCTARRHAGGAPVARGRRIGGAPCGAGRLKPAAAPPWLGRDGRLSDAPGGDEGIRHDRPSALHLPASGRGVMSGRRVGSGWRRRMMPAPQGVGGMGAPSLTTATAAAPERAEVRNRGAWMLSGPEAVSEATPRRALAVRQVGRSLEPARTGGELRGARLRASRIRRGRRSVKRRRAHGHEPCARRVSAAFAADHGSDLLLSTTGVPATQVLQTERVPLSPAATIAEPADADALIVSRAPAARGSCRTRCSRRGSPRRWPSIDRKMPWPRCRQAVPQRRPRVDLVVGEPYRCGRRAAGSRGRVSGRAGRAVDLDGGRCQ